jgi:hypothetical protein
VRLPVLTALLICGLALSACEKGKPRHVPVDPMALTPPQPTAAAPKEGMSAGLPKRNELAGVTLDRIGAAPDPLNRRPAVTPAGQPTEFAGFAFDPVAKAPGRGVDVVVDGKAYGAAYGAARLDVASYFKQPGLSAVGFTMTLPAGALAAGDHLVVLRVVAADGQGFYASPTYPFTVKWPTSPNPLRGGGD